MTTQRKHAQEGAREKAKIIVTSACFSENEAKNLTRHQFADFHADAQKLANDICDEVALTGKKVDGKKFRLRVKPKY